MPHSPVMLQNAAFLRISRYRSNQTLRYPAASKPLKIIIDISYQMSYTGFIKSPLSSVPSDPCAPATRPLQLFQYLSAQYFLTFSSLTPFLPTPPNFRP